VLRNLQSFQPRVVRGRSKKFHLWTLRIVPAWPRMFCPYLKGTGKRVANPLAFGAFWQLWRVRLA
jgi:hypothetical protein